jgi:hypothetical protein
MRTVEDILDALTDIEKDVVLHLWYNQLPLAMRVRFIKNVLIGRLGWPIQGWDIMDYNLLLNVVANRLFKKRFSILDTIYELDV